MGILQAVRGTGAGLQVTANNVTASGSGFINCGNAGSTPIPATFVAGGSGNYSFLWERIGATAQFGPWVISNASVQNPTWSAPGPVCDSGSPDTETWKVSVTDNSTGQAGNFSITVTIVWANLN